jgi:hypothetical protein
MAPQSMVPEVVFSSATAPSGQMALETLRAEHLALERRLAELDQHVALTAAEQVERAELKKRKLAAKDRMARLARLGSSG